MPRRALHWLVLSFATLWFAVLVPVHNRGEIGLPGSAPAAQGQSGHACCPAPSAPASHDSPCHAPASPRGGACAVCAFIATLDSPPPLTWVESQLGLIGLAEAPRPEDLPAARVTLPFHSRAPPAA